MSGLVAGGMAILSAGSAISANKAIAKTASANAAATSAMLSQQYGVKKTQLLDQGQEVNNQTGMALTDLIFQSMSAMGQTTSALAEGNIAGNTAKRAAGSVKMKTELKKDQIIQQGEAAMFDIANQLRTAKYDYESGNMQNTISYNNAMSQQQSALGIAAGAASAGLSGYSAIK